MKLLKKGSKGEEVKQLQRQLNLIADGIFGPITEEAVKEYQKAHGLTADGIVGDKTWAVLNAEGIFPATSKQCGNLKKSTRKIKQIFLHCSATCEGKDYTVADIRKMHVQGRGWSDIGYHYVVYRDGSIHEGRDINKIGAHVEGQNTYSIGICYIGGVADVKDAKGKYPAKDTRTPAQKGALKYLVNELMKLYGLGKQNVFGHYQFANKACPSFKIEPFRAEL